MGGYLSLNILPKNTKLISVNKRKFLSLFSILFLHRKITHITRRLSGITIKKIHHEQCRKIEGAEINNG